MVCQLEMESVKLWHYFLVAEAAFHILALVAGAFFVATFSRLRSVHIHLVIVLDSFVLAFCFTSIFRLEYTLKVLMYNLSPDDDAGALSSRLRDVGMFAGGLHMLLVAFERMLATIRAREYEKESLVPLVLIIILFLWTFSFFTMIYLLTSAASRFLIAGIFITADAVAISLMYYVQKKNLGLWRQYKGTLGITYAYQVRENVRTSLFLCRAFTVFALQSVVAILAYLGYSVFCYINDSNYNVFLRMFGFVFDLAIAVVPLTVSATIVAVHAQLRERFVKALTKGDISPQQKKVVDMVDFDGKKLAVKPKEEATVYFEQFRTAWA